MMLSLLVHIEGLCSTLLLAAMMERVVCMLDSPAKDIQADAEEGE